MEWLSDGVIRLAPCEGLSVDDAARARLRARLGADRAAAVLDVARRECAARAARLPPSPSDLRRIRRLARLLGLPQLDLAAGACLRADGNPAVLGRLHRLLVSAAGPP